MRPHLLGRCASCQCACVGHGLATKIALIFRAFALFCVGVTTALLLRESRADMAESISNRQFLFADAQAFALRERLDRVDDVTATPSPH